MPISIRGLLKPCYLFRPSALLHRIWLALSPRRSSEPVEVRLPWGDTILANPGDAIGKALDTQGIFDIAVSECAWRLIDPGARIIDAGANIGYMSLLFAGKSGEAGEVHSFEPHPHVRETLRKNAAQFSSRHGAEVIKIYEYALGSSEGECLLQEPEDFRHNQGTASLANTGAATDAGSSTLNAYPVSVKTLDSLFPRETVDLLKIDVEGHEAQVLAGAARLLSEHRIRHIIYEDHDKERSGLHETLVKQGYQVFSIGYEFWGPLLRPWNHQVAIHESWESASFLATLQPEECHARFLKRGWIVLAADSL